MLRTSKSRRRRRASWLCWKRARSWIACAACAASCLICASEARRARARRERPRAAPRVSVESCDPLHLLGAESPGQHAVDDDRLEVARERLAQAVLQLERLADGHLGRLRYGEVGAPGGVAEQRLDALGLRCDRSHARDRAERVRGPQHAERMPGGGRVERPRGHNRRGASAPAPGLGELPDLDHREQLLGAGRRRGEVLEGAAGGEEAPRDPPAELLDPLEQHPVRVDRRRVEVLLQRGLGAGPGGLRRRIAAAAGPGRRARRRSCVLRGAPRARRAWPRAWSCRPRPCR